jgi:hypothetical protein
MFGAPSAYFVDHHNKSGESAYGCRSSRESRCVQTRDTACLVNHNFPICRRQIGKTQGEIVTRPRAADDFPAIRARMEELRRERARLSDQDEYRRDNPKLPAITIGRSLTKVMVPLAITRRLMR